MRKNQYAINFDEIRWEYEKSRRVLGQTPTTIVMSMAAYKAIVATMYQNPTTNLSEIVNIDSSLAANNTRLKLFGMDVLRTEDLPNEDFKIF